MRSNYAVIKKCMTTLTKSNKVITHSVERFAIHIQSHNYECPICGAINETNHLAVINNCHRRLQVDVMRQWFVEDSALGENRWVSTRIWRFGYRMSLCSLQHTNMQRKYTGNLLYQHIYSPSVPESPMASPTSAALSAGPSFVPSPVTPTTSPPCVDRLASHSSR